MWPIVLIAPIIYNRRGRRRTTSGLKEAEVAKLRFCVLKHKEQCRVQCGAAAAMQSLGELLIREKGRASVDNFLIECTLITVKHKVLHQLQDTKS